MKFLRLDLLTLLISLFILSSCKNPDGIGLGIDPNKVLQANLVDTATIFTNTVRDDSVVTSNITNVPLAYFKDPVLGTTTSDIATSLNLPGNAAFTLPSGTITSIDSAVLVLAYGDGFYGDSLTTNYKVNVYQLKEPLVASKPYYNNRVWSFDNTKLLGTKMFIPRPKDSVKISQIVVGAKDTLKKEPPQIRIPIDKNWVFNNFFLATTSQLTTNSVFLNYIKGLYITIDKPNTTGGPGGIIYLAIGSGKCSLDVYYKVTETNGTTIDTTLSSLPLGTPHAATISYDRSVNPTLVNQLANPTANSSTLYLQGLSGLRARVAFPYLKNMLPANTANNDIVLNRAELVVTPVPGTDVPFAPTPRLTLYRFDIAHQKTTVPDATSGDPRYLSVGSFGGFFDTYHRSYSFVITGYIEDLMRGKTVDYGTFIAPCDTAGVSVGSPSIDISNSPEVGSRVVVGGNKTSAYKMKLNIIYNKVTK